MLYAAVFTVFARRQATNMIHAEKVLKCVEKIHEVHKQIQNNQSWYGTRWAPTSYKYDYISYK